MKKIIVILLCVSFLALTWHKWDELLQRTSYNYLVFRLQSSNPQTRGWCFRYGMGDRNLSDEQVFEILDLIRDETNYVVMAHAGNWSQRHLIQYGDTRFLKFYHDFIQHTNHSFMHREQHMRFLAEKGGNYETLKIFEKIASNTNDVYCSEWAETHMEYLAERLRSDEQLDDSQVSQNHDQQ